MINRACTRVNLKRQVMGSLNRSHISLATLRAQAITTLNFLVASSATVTKATTEMLRLSQLLRIRALPLRGQRVDMVMVSLLSEVARPTRASPVLPKLLQADTLHPTQRQQLSNPVSRCTLNLRDNRAMEEVTSMETHTTETLTMALT